MGRKLFSKYVLFLLALRCSELPDYFNADQKLKSVAQKSVYCDASVEINETSDKNYLNLTHLGRQLTGENGENCI